MGLGQRESSPPTGAREKGEFDPPRSTTLMSFNQNFVLVAYSFQ